MKSMTIRMDDDLKEMLHETAKQECRSVSNLMRFALKKYCRKEPCFPQGKMGASRHNQ